MGSLFFGSMSIRDNSSAKAAQKEEEERLARRERMRKENQERLALEEANVEIRYGMRINPHPAVALEAPPAPPPLSEAEQAARKKADEAATALITDNIEKYAAIVKAVSLFSEMGQEELHMAARALEVVSFRAGEVVYDEGTEGRDAWVLEEGVVVASVLIPGIAGAGWEWKETRKYKPGKFGSFFGERGLRRGEPRQMRMTSNTDIKALRITQKNFVACARMREYKENLLRGVRLFEQMTDDQIGKLAAVMQMQHFDPSHRICSAGEPCSEFFLIESGEATTARPPYFTTPRSYLAGECFNDRALLEDLPISDQTVIAHGESGASIYTLTREAFENQLGPLADLQMEQLRADPRTLLALFYQTGDRRGPAGSLRANGLTASESSSDKTNWFAVYRPCSRDSIAKMLGRVGVGKGLNIKGKSAKKNRLSGFVPFLQISDNLHKKDVEKSPKDARTKIFYKNVMAREEALATLTKVMQLGGDDLEVGAPRTTHHAPRTTHHYYSFAACVPLLRRRSRVAPLHDACSAHRLHPPSLATLSPSRTPPHSTPPFSAFASPTIWIGSGGRAGHTCDRRTDSGFPPCMRRAGGRADHLHREHVRATLVRPGRARAGGARGVHYEARPFAHCWLGDGAAVSATVHGHEFARRARRVVAPCRPPSKRSLRPDEPAWLADRLRRKVCEARVLRFRHLHGRLEGDEIRSAARCAPSMQPPLPPRSFCRRPWTLLPARTRAITHPPRRVRMLLRGPLARRNKWGLCIGSSTRLNRCSRTRRRTQRAGLTIG